MIAEEPTDLMGFDLDDEENADVNILINDINQMSGDEDEEE